MYIQSNFGEDPIGHCPVNCSAPICLGRHYHSITIIKAVRSQPLTRCEKNIAYIPSIVNTASLKIERNVA